MRVKSIVSCGIEGESSWTSHLSERNNVPWPLPANKGGSGRNSDDRGAPCLVTPLSES